MPRSSSNNVRAGLFVLIAIGLAFVCVLALSGLTKRLKSFDRYVVRFTLATGAAGLEVGSQVQVGGRMVGQVEEIRLRTQPEGSNPAGIDIEIEVDSGVRFFGTPVAYLERPLLGAGATLNFSSVGNAAAESPVTPGSVLRGEIAAPSFLAQAGYGEEQKSQLQTILQRGSEIAEDIRGLSKDLREKTGPDIQAVVSDVRGRSTAWFDRIDSVTANADSFAAALPQVGEDAKALARQLREAVDDNRERFDRIVANIDQAAQGVNDETMPLVNDLLRDGKAAMGEARTALEKIDRLVTEEEPGLRKSLANARLASDQLRLTMAEVRRSPWRLLYRPDARETEFGLLYDAARTYADAVSDLRSASETLRAAQTTGGDPGTPASNADRLSLLLRNLETSFETYRTAERRFLDLVIGADAKPATK